MFKHIDGDNTVELPARDWKVVIFERIYRFIQKPGDLVIVFARYIDPSPCTTMLTEMPVESPIVIAARDE
jgi:hypothetical protein